MDLIYNCLTQMNTNRILVLALSLVLAQLVACGGGGSTPPVQPPPTPQISQLSADLSEYVTTTLPYVQSGSEGYVVPSQINLDRFDALLADLLAGDTQAALDVAAALNFELIRLTDTGNGDNELYCLRELILRGQGFYCVDFDSAAAHHVSAPHPLYDSNTNTESVTVMRGTSARFLSVATAHRCANSAATVCSGTTSACGAPGPYRVSDVAHNVDAFFHHFGINVHDRSTTTHTLQVHGCGSTSCPSNLDDNDIVARVSAGTTMDLPGDETVNRIKDALNAEIAPYSLGVALSCSEPVADKRLCGTTNPLSRYINGQADPCQNPATSFTDSRWLHIEQNRNLRVDDGAGDDITPNTLIEAINTTLGP